LRGRRERERRERGESGERGKEREGAFFRDIVKEE